MTLRAWAKSKAMTPEEKAAKKVAKALEKKESRAEYSKLAKEAKKAEAKATKNPTNENRKAAAEAHRAALAKGEQHVRSHGVTAGFQSTVQHHRTMAQIHERNVKEATEYMAKAGYQEQGAQEAPKTEKPAFNQAEHERLKAQSAADSLEYSASNARERGNKQQEAGLAKQAIEQHRLAGDHKQADKVLERHASALSSHHPEMLVERNQKLEAKVNAALAKEKTEGVGVRHVDGVVRMTKDKTVGIGVRNQYAGNPSKMTDPEKRYFEYSSVADRAGKRAAELKEEGKSHLAKTWHKSAGEAHLRAAKEHSDPAKVKEHKEKAAEHAKAAGGEWDDEKHPRDEQGRFT